MSGKKLKFTGKRGRIPDIMISDITLKKARIAEERTFLLRMSGGLHEWLKSNVEGSINEFILNSIREKIEGIKGAEPRQVPSFERPTVGPKEAAELELRHRLAELEERRAAAEEGRWPSSDSEVCAMTRNAIRARVEARFRKENVSDEEWLEYEEELGRLEAELGFSITERKEGLGREYERKYREREKKEKRAV